MPQLLQMGFQMIDQGAMGWLNLLENWIVYNRQQKYKAKQQKSMKYTNSIVNQYVSQSFLPQLWEAIRVRQVQKRVQRHMPRVISNHMMLDLLDSTAKNNNILRKAKNKQQFIEVNENRKEPQDIKLRMKKYSKAQSAFIKYEHSDDQQQTQESRPISNQKYKSSLIKLPNPDEDQGQQIVKIRKLKERMRRFEKQILERGLQNSQFNQDSARKKKSVHSQCKYHTYDYQSNVMPVDPDMNAEDDGHSKKSLLQCLKKNLDKQIEDETIAKKLNQIEQKHKHVKFNVPTHKINKVEDRKQQSSNKKERIQQNLTHLRPLYKFQLSHVQSLSNNFDKYIEDGIKLVTHQQKIVEQQNPEGPRFQIKKQKNIHERVSPKKQNTLSSQSIIYSLQKNLKNSGIRDNKSELSNQLTKKYQSLQLDREQQQSKLSQYYLYQHNYKQIKSTTNTPAVAYDIKLPQIRFNSDGRRLINKRTSTQQKMIKGLDHIEIQVKSPHRGQQMRNHQRSGLFSAFSANKHTQSSIQQPEFDRLSVGGKNKKTFIKDYFNNYSNQYRFKRDIMEKLALKS